MAKLNIEWGKLADPSVTTGASAGEVIDSSSIRGILSPELRQFDRPIVVYVESNTDENRTSRELIENTTLKDERVAISARLFTMVKANGDGISETHPYGRILEAGKDEPRFIVFSAAGERIGKLDGRVSPSRLFALMKKAAVADYVCNLDRLIKDYQKVLTVIDKLAGLKLALDQKEERDTSASAKREIAERRAKLDAEEASLRETEQQIFDVKRRNAL